jgi:hypothetical protein
MPKVHEADSLIVLLGSNWTSPESEQFYPIPKFADFGLATLTDFENRASNRASALQKGQPLWVPPELRIDYMLDLTRYFFQDDTDSVDFEPLNPNPRTQHRIRSEANIWGVGAVMWALTTFGDIRLLSQNINGILMGNRDACATFDGTNVIPAFDKSIEERYSHTLLRLIQKCTRMRPCMRPCVHSLLQIIEPQMQELERELEAIRFTGDESRLKVYFKGNEFNGLPEGDAELPPKTPKFWSDFANHLIWQPPECELFCPPSAPTKLHLTGRCPDAVRRSVQRKWKAAVQVRDNKSPVPTRSSSLPIPTNSRRRKRRANEMDGDETENVGRWTRWLRRWKWWEK